MRCYILFLISFLLLTGVGVSAQQNTAVAVSVNAASGRYSIESPESHWTFYGNTGQALSHVERSEASDEAGAFDKISFTWDKGNRTGAIRWYKNKPVVIFTLTLPNGADGPLSGFPDFNTLPDSLYHFSYHNDVFAAPQFVLNRTSTPWLLFDKNNDACIVSPASGFMTAVIKGDGIHSITSTQNEAITKFPKGFSYSTIMVLGSGIRSSWNDWGAVLRALYHRKYPDKDADPLLKYYGYWTDNGADYYYNYDTTLGYEKTLLKLKQYYQDQHIPMGYMQLDSWWYEKTNFDPDGKPGDNFKNKNLPEGPWNKYGGLLEYVADPFLFPKGMSDFQRRLGIPMATHNRWIDPLSPYHKKYKISGIMSPDPKFWEDIMHYLKSSGVVCYEQDWLNYIYSNSPEMQSTLTAGNLFTDGMANAAEKNNMTLQYCMAMPRYFLQGLKYNNLTTIRTSEDRFEPGKWKNFIFTSQLAYQIGAMPWCDVFKSHELGNMILSVLSSGPVGTGDAIGKENKSNIMLACREDGQIIRPDVPVLPLDKDYVSLAEHQSVPLLAYTYTKHDNIQTDYLFAFCNKSNSKRSLTFTPEEIGIRGNAVVYNPLSKSVRALSSGELFTDTLSQKNYTYYIIAPVTASGIAFLGDAGKIAATGKKRIASIEQAGKTLKVEILFAPGEKEVTVQGYCKGNVRSDKGELINSSSAGIFNLRVVNDGSNAVEISLAKK